MRLGRPVAILLVALAALLAAVRNAAAIRPFDGTDASVTDEGTVEFEMGPVDWLEAYGDDVFAPLAVVNVGVLRDWEFSAYAQPAWRISQGDGRRFALLDDGLVLKGILREGSLQDRAGPSVGVEFATLLPATPPFDHFGARITPVVSQTWNGFTGHLSASLLWSRLHEPAAAGSLILEGPEVVRGVRPAVEATTAWERDLGRGWSGLAALLWSARDDLDFDVGFRFGHGFGTSVRELRAGVTWRIRAWDPHD